MSPKEIWIENETNGRPFINITDNIKKILASLEIEDFDVSLSHHEEYTIATVILFKN